MSVLKRLAASIGAGIGMALVSAVGIAIANLYVTGHGGASLLTPVINEPRLGIVLGIGDIIMLAAAISAAVFVWIVTRNEH